MIESFRHKGLRTFFEDDDRRKIPAAQGDTIARILARLNEAMKVQDMGLRDTDCIRSKGSGRFLVGVRFGQLEDYFPVRTRHGVRCGFDRLPLAGEKRCV